MFDTSTTVKTQLSCRRSLRLRCSNLSPKVLIQNCLPRRAWKQMVRYVYYQRYYVELQKYRRPYQRETRYQKRYRKRPGGIVSPHRHQPPRCVTAVLVFRRVSWGDPRTGFVAVTSFSAETSMKKTYPLFLIILTSKVAVTETWWFWTAASTAGSLWSTSVAATGTRSWRLGSISGSPPWEVSLV